MKKFVISALGHRIYYATVREDKPGFYVCTGKKEDFTEECLAIVFEWFAQNMEGKQEYSIRYPGTKLEEFKLKMVRVQGEDNILCL